MSTRTRWALTAAVIAAAWALGGWLASPAVQTIGSAELAGLQFQDSDASALAATAGLGLLRHVPWWLCCAALAAIAAIWSGPALRRLAPALVLGAVFAASGPAHAYFSTTDKTEAVTIMPNESAFWIPDVGANKDSQSSMDSEAYFAANKISLKRFVIPHAKLPNTGGWIGFDSYVPTGRMIIVDRAPYYREWTKAATRGTSMRDESIPCQTKEGLNIITEIGISASVAEENSPKFLHYFGVNNPQGDRADPAVIFTSVYYGRSLTQVMDGIGRGLVHTIVCREIASRGFDEANAQASQIMDTVQAAATKFLGERGITLDYIGWTGTWTFDADIQRAVNDAYSGAKIAPVLPQLQAKAMVDALEQWDHKLPASVNLSWWPGSLGQALAALAKPATAP